MITLCLALLLAQDPAAEAKKLLDAVLPLKNDQPYVQLVCEFGPDGGMPGFSKTIYFKRGKAYRVDYPSQSHGFDGTRFWSYQKARNEFSRWKGPGSGSGLFHELLAPGGVLAEICMYGTADRILKAAKTVTVVREPLDGVPCSHLALTFKGKGPDVHVWIDGKNRLLRNHFKGPDQDVIVTYKFVDPPATDESLFSFTPPPDAKDISRPEDR